MIRRDSGGCRATALRARVITGLLCVLCGGFSLVQAQLLRGQETQATLSKQEAAIVKSLQGLRQLPDETRGRVMKQLALEIRALPSSPHRVELATDLATLSTEGDPGGSATLQAVATTLADCLRQQPQPARQGKPALPYVELATLVRYEHLQVSLASAQFTAAMTQLEAEDARRERANFTLADLQGRKWSLRDLRGKVVLVNFWATWCPPCRKEIPDLQALQAEFENQGLVILGIDDETASKVESFIREHKMTYPVLLDPGDKVHKLYSVEGIPMSFLYDAQGKLVAEAIDMRTREQFLGMLAKAGIH